MVRVRVCRCVRAFYGQGHPLVALLAPAWA